MIKMLSDVLGIPPQNVVPFDDWVSRVRSSTGPVGKDNPAAQIVEFLSEHFVRMSCGDMILDTTKCVADSLTLRCTGPVGLELLRKYIVHWKESGFIN